MSMQNLDDIKYAVRDEEETEEIVAFFSEKRHAEKFIKCIMPSGVILDRSEHDFYIDIQVETTSSFDIRS